MTSVALSEAELEEVISQLRSGQLKDKLVSRQKYMLDRKEMCKKDLLDPDFKGCKLYAVHLDAFDCSYAGYHIGKNADEACEGAGETLAQTNFGDWNADAEEVQ